MVDIEDPEGMSYLFILPIEAPPRKKKKEKEKKKKEKVKKKGKIKKIDLGTNARV